MKDFVKKILFIAHCILISPLYMCFLISGNKEIIRYEISMYMRNVIRKEASFIYAFFAVLTKIKDYRNIFYLRLGIIGKLLNVIYSGRKEFYMFNKSEFIGKGLIVHHAVSTRISCRKIGEDCQVWQLVTVGKGKPGPGLTDTPVLGNRVKVCVGAIVVGAITVGDDVIIAAGAVVTKDVPNGCVVAGNPARIIKRNGVRVSEKL